jgi:anti-sigma B factor antagonist
MRSEPSLEYTVHVREGRAVLGLSGELSSDGWTEELLTALSEHYINDGVREIEVDLTALSFVDMEGVATLLRLLGEARARDKVFVTTGARGRVRAKLEQAGVLGLLEGGT